MYFQYYFFMLKMKNIIIFGLMQLEWVCSLRFIEGLCYLKFWICYVYQWYFREIINFLSFDSNMLLYLFYDYYDQSCGVFREVSDSVK